jgi:hypothetical protein
MALVGLWHGQTKIISANIARSGIVSANWVSLSMLLRRDFSGCQLTPFGKSGGSVEFEYFTTDEMALTGLKQD